ncbi:MAG: Coenzyme F420 hydrogenase/dehydrogenase, beta subunit C-terminal domain [Rhizobiaceae bacterium]|nr:Coenzyme F420 hydrogenase/dehydrogenase, beta subunit C-terminal domain [Rhizobiaceae bacterium]
MLEKRTDPNKEAHAPHRTMCTDCGVSRTTKPERCGQACQFIKPNYPAMETAVHGRARDSSLHPDEHFFGPFLTMKKARLAPARKGAQWTGITSEIGKRLLERKAVDAVIAVKPHPIDRWKPEPVIVTDPADMAQCRGMRMGFAPSVALVEKAMDEGHKRIAFIGIPCQVYALRSLEKELGFEKLYVIGTPCSDNTTTANFHKFLELLSSRPETINYLEFRADYQVELRFDDGSQQEIPFLKLPISKLPGDFFPLTCQTCVDYANSLSDVTIGYMAGEGDQWLIVRNKRGAELIGLLEGKLITAPLGSAGKRRKHVEGFMANVKSSVNGLPLRSMPNFLRPIVAWLMPKVGPKGLEFARTRVEMKAIEAILHLRKKAPAKVKNMVPDHIWKLAAPYGVKKQETE